MTSDRPSPAAPTVDSGHLTAKIVAGIDGSVPSMHALEWAARQAELTGAALEVVMTWEWPTSYGWVAPWPEGWDPSAEVSKLLETATNDLHSAHPDLVVTARVLEGHPAEQLVEVSREADLLVLGSRGHGEFVGMLIGSVSEHCAAKAHCPVVIHHQPDD